MSELPNLGLAMAVSLLLSTLVVLVLAKPLRAILGQLCPGTGATHFWVSFTAVMLYITPLMFAVWSNQSYPNLGPASIVRTALGASLFGTFAALLVVAYQIVRNRPSTP
jgi:hypothetical protein